MRPQVPPPDSGAEELNFGHLLRPTSRQRWVFPTQNHPFLLTLQEHNLVIRIGFRTPFMSMSVFQSQMAFRMDHLIRCSQSLVNK